jgi:hypothetical protein
MIFIEADHSYEKSFKDFQNAQDHLLGDGFIFVHDTYLYSKTMFSPDLFNDGYMTPLYLERNLPSQFELTSLPFIPGLPIIKKRNGQIVLAYLSEVTVRNFDYQT